MSNLRERIEDHFASSLSGVDALLFDAYRAIGQTRISSEPFVQYVLKGNFTEEERATKHREDLTTEREKALALDHAVRFALGADPNEYAPMADDGGVGEHNMPLEELAWRVRKEKDSFRAELKQLVAERDSLTTQLAEARDINRTSQESWNTVCEEAGMAGDVTAVKQLCDKIDLLKEEKTTAETALKVNESAWSEVCVALGLPKDSMAGDILEEIAGLKSDQEESVADGPSSDSKAIPSPLAVVAAARVDDKALSQIHQGVSLSEGPPIPSAPEGVATKHIDQLVGEPTLPGGMDVDLVVRYFQAMAEPGIENIMRTLGVSGVKLRDLHTAFREKTKAYTALVRPEAKEYFLQRLRVVLEAVDAA